MVNYQDHQGSFKWQSAHGDDYRAPKRHRFSLKYTPVAFVAVMTVVQLCQAFRITINNLSYWEQRVIYT